MLEVSVDSALGQALNTGGLSALGQALNTGGLSALG